MNTDDIQILEKTTKYSGFFKLEFYRLRHRLHDGGWSGVMDRELFERGHAAAVLPYDPVAEAVVLLNQFRLGSWAGGMPAWQTEIVAGIIGAGEAPEAVATREAREESGCEIADLVPLFHYAVSPGGTTETVHLFVARVDSRGLGGVHGLEHEHEDIRVDVVKLADAMAMLEDGRIQNAFTIIALQWLALHRDRLHTRWGGVRPA